MCLNHEPDLGHAVPEWRTRQLGRFIFPLQAVLAGIILSNVIPYLETIYYLPTLWRQDQCDCVSTAATGVERLGEDGWSWSLQGEQNQPELSCRQHH